MAYCGTHETTKFGERDSGNLLLVEIAGRGAVPKLTPLHSGGLAWTTLVEEIRLPGDLARVRQQVESLKDPQATLLDLTLSGVLCPEDQSELRRIDELIVSRCLFGRLENLRLMPMPENDAWLASLPPGPVQDAAREIQAWTGTSSDHPVAVSRETAVAALLELFATVNEMGA
jgi:hypothetical protein